MGYKYRVVTLVLGVVVEVQKREKREKLQRSVGEIDTVYEKLRRHNEVACLDCNPRS